MALLRVRTRDRFLALAWMVGAPVAAGFRNVARSAAPYYHRRLKPADLAPDEPRKTELIVSWMPPEEVLAAERAKWERSRGSPTAE